MARESIIQPPPPPDDNDGALRPKRIAEMVGQREVIEVLRIAIDAATKREEPLGHILFDGPPGWERQPLRPAFPARWAWQYNSPVARH